MVVPAASIDTEQKQVLTGSISLRARYAMYSTDIAVHGTAECGKTISCDLLVLAGPPISLCPCYAMSGTDPA
eukprot:2945817-Rhodomonas_salina.2